jgi:hypothetical protein
LRPESLARKAARAARRWAIGGLIRIVRKAMVTPTGTTYGLTRLKNMILFLYGCAGAAWILRKWLLL